MGIFNKIHREEKRFYEKLEKREMREGQDNYYVEYSKTFKEWSISICSGVNDNPYKLKEFIWLKDAKDFCDEFNKKDRD